eukprot:3723842-Alexandrium_andersonii.AAC.1
MGSDRMREAFGWRAVKQKKGCWPGANRRARVRPGGLAPRASKSLSTCDDDGVRDTPLPSIDIDRKCQCPGRGPAGWAVGWLWGP